MNSFNSAEPYVSPHMLSFAGFESCSGSTSSCQRQQLWDWDTINQAPSAALHQTTGLFTNDVGNNSSSYNDYTEATVAPAMGAGGIVGGYSYLSAGGAYPAALVKNEDDWVFAGHNIGLNLGHRTYFPTGDAVGIDLFRRGRGFYQVNQQLPRCQAEGCKADLTGAKHYHRRHKVCEFHSKAAMVVAGGMQQRFCQQCSRFHPLSEFDEAKRSCRRRLAEHNRRRRKSQGSTPATGMAAGDSSTPPDTSTTSMEKSKQTVRSTGKHAGNVIMTATAATVCSSSSNSQINISLDSPKDCKKKTTYLRNGPDLSLGGGAAGAHKGGFGFQCPEQTPWAVTSDENNFPQEQPCISYSSSSPPGIFFHSRNFLCGGANEEAQSATVDHHGSNLQLSHGMLE